MITQRWKIPFDISRVDAGKLRLHQFRNSLMAIKNAIKAIRRDARVRANVFPMVRRGQAITSSAILNKDVLSPSRSPPLPPLSPCYLRHAASSSITLVVARLAGNKFPTLFHTRVATESSLREFSVSLTSLKMDHCTTRIFHLPPGRNSFHFGSVQEDARQARLDFTRQRR